MNRQMEREEREDGETAKTNDVSYTLQINYKSLQIGHTYIV